MPEVEEDGLVPTVEEAREVVETGLPLELSGSQCVERPSKLDLIGVDGLDDLLLEGSQRRACGQERLQDEEAANPEFCTDPLRRSYVHCDVQLPGAGEELPGDVAIFGGYTDMGGGLAARPGDQWPFVRRLARSGGASSRWITC